MPDIIGPPRPGDMGELVAWHGRYYAERMGYGPSFEAEVAAQLGEFLLQTDPARDGLWTARVDDRFAGGLALDARPEHDCPRLRWFLVPPGFQGRRLGSRLLDAALTLARERGHARLYLWTVDGLPESRRLYETRGFRLVQSLEKRQWGTAVLAMRFDLSLA